MCSYRVGGDGLEPVVVEVKEHHLRLSRLEDQVSKLLHLETCLEWQLQLRALDHDVREVKQVHLTNTTASRIIIKTSQIAKEDFY